MKNALLILTICSSFAISCNTGDTQEEVEGISADAVANPVSASDSESDIVLPKLNFESIEFDFGEIAQGEKVNHAFKFTNEGESTLIISAVSAKCGCTVTSWPKEPIEAGESNAIEVVYSSEGREGHQAMVITVISNSMPNTTVLKITGDVLTTGND